MVLFVELFQTEEDAVQHCRTEAERIPGTPPALALLAIAEHAALLRPDLDALATVEGLTTTTLGARVGNALAMARDFFLDRTLSREKSYRGTLIGVHHGVDLVTLVRATAAHANRARVVGFCDTWLARRPALVAAAVHALSWFAAHSETAAQRATRVLDDVPAALDPSVSDPAVGPM